MIHILAELNEEISEEIDQYVDDHAGGSPFHLASWMNVLIDTYSFRPHCIISRNNAGKIQGLLPFVWQRGICGGRKLCALPFSDFCGPLADAEEATAEIAEQLDILKGLFKGGVEVRNAVDKKSDYISRTYFRHHFIPLPHEMRDAIRTFNKRSVQYSIRKAEKAGVVVREENNEEGIRQFERLNSLTRRKHGMPPQPHRLFVAIYNRMVANGRGHVLLGFYKDTAIAGVLLLRTKGTVVYKYSASDPKILTLLAPNHLITWRAIELSRKLGAKVFDFGRTELNNAGLLRFKEMWSTKQEDLPYSYYPAPSGALHIYQNSRLTDFGKNIWRLLPIPIASRIGGLIYKYLS
jgi:lipid II:glycine glycyltransferase (peptidoglycan interpeptide bridge formation enzyme)